MNTSFDDLLSRIDREIAEQEDEAKKVKDILERANRTSIFTEGKLASLRELKRKLLEETKKDIPDIAVAEEEYSAG